MVVEGVVVVLEVLLGGVVGGLGGVDLDYVGWLW